LAHYHVPNCNDGLVFSEDYHLEQAFCAQVTFIGDNGNFVTIQEDENLDQLPMEAVNTFSELSNILLSNSNSQDHDGTIEALNVKPTAKNIEVSLLSTSCHGQ
jgi:hypothetical protein